VTLRLPTTPRPPDGHAAHGLPRCCDRLQSRSATMELQAACRGQSAFAVLQEAPMDIKLQLLESFHAHGSDGQTYKVFGYERLARDESVTAAIEHWQSTGVSEYRLADGRFVDERDDGSLLIERSDVRLMRA
jgi:hypothetical protein